MNDVPRLPQKEAAILECLIQASPRSLYGLEIVTASSGRVGQGTVYVTLARLEKKGFVTFTPGELPAHGGLPRPLYSVSALGVRAYMAWQAARDAAKRAWEWQEASS
jgi:DNA-binding PadR family transcriptional regulator